MKPKRKILSSWVPRDVNTPNKSIYSDDSIFISQNTEMQKLFKCVKWENEWFKESALSLPLSHPLERVRSISNPSVYSIKVEINPKILNVNIYYTIWLALSIYS